MTQAQRVLDMAHHMRELARDCVLPGYMEKMSRSAEELEQRAAELQRQARDAGQRTFR